MKNPISAQNFLLKFFEEALQTLSKRLFFEFCKSNFGHTKFWRSSNEICLFTFIDF